MPAEEIWEDDEDDEFFWVEVSEGRSKLVKRNSYTRTSVPVTDGKVLNAAETRSIENLTGIPGVSTWQEAKAAVGATGSRFIEKGEAQDRMREENRQWLASGRTVEQRGRHPSEGRDLYPEKAAALRRPGRLREMYIKNLVNKGIPLPEGLRR